ncbi:tetratricopeptide repeat protein [Helicobacter macacae]|uniref:beta-lactamase n=1 Tax=Helicobacter macacae MIT 99-5501 TaxID=1357400 RepID=V8C9Z6_9HELI|nr:SEL1-like repeat protein [Helicobacter macacae]ETD24238.1 hypothetical protein HMPREF2086_00988 [Helicobacter macacae MIT 99-5501]
MKRLVLACGILASVVSVSIGAMSDDEWQRARHNCFDNRDKNSCYALINDGLPSVEQCYAQKGKGNCSFVGGIYYFAGRYKEAIPYFEKTIALGDNLGYVSLASVYHDLQDYYNAKKYYEIACDTIDGFLMQADACLVVAKMYDRGQGVKRNSSTAKQYYGKACNLGNQRACSEILLDMVRLTPEYQKLELESKKRELESKKLELERLELEQKLQKYR